MSRPRVFSRDSGPPSEESTDRIADAIAKLRALAGPKPAKKAPTFESVLEHLEAVNAELEKRPHALDDRQRANIRRRTATPEQLGGTGGA
jgi:hypothetical protein